LEEPLPISWARLRRQILSDVRQLQDILEHHQNQGLLPADLQVIKRGKALEYYSRHYGQVYVEQGREFTVKEALAGINQILEEEGDSTREAPPVLAEPYTRQFLRLFDGETVVERDQIQKYLRGTGIAPGDFVYLGWCSPAHKQFIITSPLIFAKNWNENHRLALNRDYEQAMVLVGACYDDSGINASVIMNAAQFKPHPALPGLLTWLERHGGNIEICGAARRASALYTKWERRNQEKVIKQLDLFDLTGEEV